MEAESHTPRVAGLMRRIRLRQLRNITLAHVLADDTSRPISLSNFEAYMTFSENALQELQFIVWFQDYAARFFALADDEQRRSPGPPAEAFEHRCRLRGLLARLRRKSAAADAGLLSPTACSEKAPGEKSARHRPCQYSRMRALSDASESTAVGGDCSGTCVCQQPFREECLHVMHTFFRPESSKALRIDKAMRRATAIRLGQSTHPDVFADAYEYIYNRIENVSLPQFILVASTNMSMRKQMLWYCVGFLSLLTSLALALTTILAIPGAHRAYRTFAVPFWTFACVSLYASHSGICPYMVCTEPRRLHAWELEEADGRTRACVASTALLYPLGGAPRLPPINSPLPVIVTPLSPAVTVARSTHHASTASSSTVGSSIVRGPALDSQQTIHSAATPDADTELHVCYDAAAPPSPSDANILESGRLRNGFRRPPIFGPNTVTLDARIRSVHIKTVQTSVFVSLACTTVFCAVLYSVPSLKH